MADIILFTSSEKLISLIKEIFPSENNNIFSTTNVDECMKKLYSENIDGVIVDYSVDEDLSSLSRKIKVIGKKKQPFVLLYAPINYENELLFRYIDGFIPENSAKSQVAALLNSAVKIEKNFNELTKNNTELAKNIYQLDVLYNTSSGFASTLNKKKLIDLMIQSVQRSIYPSFTSVYIKETNTLYLCSNRKPTKRLEEALKLRALLSYKEVYQNEEADLSVLKIEKIFTEEYSEIDLQLFNYDNIFSLITLSDRNYGFIEVFKEADFSPEDLTSLQSILKQVSSPLENAILYQEIKDTNAKLERLERLKSDFISIVSHELRTPLTPIKNSLDIILKGMTGDVSEQTLKFVGMAKRNVDRLSDIINDLLDLSKIEAGKMEFRFETKSVIPAIEYVKSTFEQTAKNKNINFTLSKDDEIPDLYIDSKRIEQIVSNMVSNALKFTQENGSVTIECKNITYKNLLDIDFYEQSINEDYENYVQISVKDTGIGINKEDIPKIFDKFQQIENSLSREIGGTGLGLPIAKQLTQAHQGLIWLESEINKGTCFSIAIPVMNDLQIFKTNFNQVLCNSKQLKKTISIFMIKELNSEYINRAISEEKLNILNNTATSNSIKYKEGNENVYICYMQDIDEYAVNFIIKKLQSFVKTEVPISEQEDIMLSIVSYPKDGLTFEILTDKLNKNLKRVIENGKIGV